jgi:1-acyl-sn-glycerol-3-phosphate acyltransferase
MKSQRASKLHFYWIAFMTGVHTLYYSIKVILGSFFVRDYRNFVNRAVYTWSRKLLSLIGVKVNVQGMGRVPESHNRPMIVMCNHCSLYDIPVSIVTLKDNLRMLAKKELFKIPVFSAALRRGEFVSIDRQNAIAGKKDLELAKQRMLDGIILWVAPEGTRSKNGKLAAFKRGAFQLALDVEAVILPIVIKDIHQVQNGDDLTLYLNRDVNVEICSPIDSCDYGKEKRQLLVNDVRQAMLRALGQDSDNVPAP